MARSLPAKVENSPPVLTREQELIIQALVDGATPAQIARKIAPHDAKKRKKWRAKLRYLIMQPAIQEVLAANLRAEQILNIGSQVKALNRKGRAGRVDAIKLAFESSGFYNPRTEVNHSGDIQITIKTVARPKPVEDDVVDVTDAEIVD